MFKTTLLLIFLKFLMKSTNSFEFPPNPCPSIFEYIYKGGNWFGYITVPAPPFTRHSTFLSVNFSISGFIGSYGPIVIDEQDQVIDKIRNGELLKFIVTLPQSEYLPQVTQIIYDDNILCRGPPVPAPSTSFWLQYSFKWTGSYYPVYTPPSQGTYRPKPSPQVTYRPKPTPQVTYRPKPTPQVTYRPKPSPQVTYRPKPPPVIHKPTTYTDPQDPPIRKTATTVSKSRKYSNYIECGTISKKRGTRDVEAYVYNGIPVADNLHPWLVALFNLQTSGNGVFFCAGNLISKKHVLSAAHCTIAVENSNIEVRLGVHNTKNLFDPGTVKRKAQLVIQHPDYRAGNAHADISFIVLDNEVSFTQAVKPICLWNFNSDFNAIIGFVGTIMGWGLQENGEQSNIPMQADVSISTKEKCREIDLLKNFVTEETFCAGTKGTGPCLGDSGGGLFLIIDSKWYLRGIISTSVAERRTQVCDVNTFSVYVDTAKYMNWIVDMMDTN